MISFIFFFLFGVDDRGGCNKSVFMFLSFFFFIFFHRGFCIHDVHNIQRGEGRDGLLFRGSLFEKRQF